MLDEPSSVVEDALIAFADEVPPLFFRLRGLVDRLHGDSCISAGGRSVLRDLVTLGPKSVPELAAMRSISRQAVQQVVDDLVSMALVHIAPNPRHKRSPLWSASAEGVELHNAMRQREKAALRNLAGEFTPFEIDASLQAIRFISKALAGHFPEVEDLEIK